MITRQQWTKIREVLSWAGGAVHLRCDGYSVVLRVAPRRPLTYIILPYVNGELSPAWFDEECEESRRFLRRCEIYLHPHKYRAAMLKIWGRRIPAEKRREINRKVVRYDWCWKSPSALQRHLIANNHEIELVTATLFGHPVAPDHRVPCSDAMSADTGGNAADPAGSGDIKQAHSANRAPS